MQDNDTARSAYTAGLRQLADILDAHPEVPLPYEGAAIPISFYFLSGDDPKTTLAAAARAMPCRLDKEAISAGGADYFDLNGKLAGLRIKMTAFRKDVCERVVVATREEIVEEPDPEAVAALPKVTRTVKVEDVRWECTPLLNGDAR